MASASNGLTALREAIINHLAEEGMMYEPQHVIVTPSAKQALYEAIQILVDKDDEVVLLDPAWVSYEAMVKLAGGQPIHLDLTPHDFQLEPALEDLSEVVSDDTKLLMLNSPANPTGTVFSQAALDGVRELAVTHDITVVSDEIYSAITYGVEPTSIAALDGMREQTITVSGLSKGHAMTGWRLGYLAGPTAFLNKPARFILTRCRVPRTSSNGLVSRASKTLTLPSPRWLPSSRRVGTCYLACWTTTALRCQSPTAPST